MTRNLTPAAQKWLKAHPSNTIDRLIELAAGDTWLALRIAKALNLDHPDRRHKKRGKRSVVTDDQLMALRAQGMTYAAIGKEIGLDRRWVSERINKIKKEKE